MPEIPDSGTVELRQKVKDIREKTKEDIGRRKKSIEKAVDKSELKYIAQGAECVVVGDKKDPEKVIAFTYKDLEPEKAKEIFYMHRIMSTLFPHNFPKFYASWAKQGESDFSGTYRQKVEGDQSEPTIGPGHESIDERSRHPFGDVVQLVKELRIPVDFDDTDVNFVLAEDGGVYYIDTIIPTRNYAFGDYPKTWDKEKIVRHMQTQKHSEREIKRVENAIDRIQEIVGEVEI